MTIINSRQRISLDPYADHVSLWFHYKVMGLAYQHRAAGSPRSMQGVW